LARATPNQVNLEYADLKNLPTPIPRDQLKRRIAKAVELCPCELLFLHRDAEQQDPKRRYEELERCNKTGLPHVAVVPIHMQEAWMLHDEAALREAAGRPSGREPLNLPKITAVERLSNPKNVLRDALKVASGASGRRLENLRPDKLTHDLAQRIEDWSPLLQLSAFQRLEQDTRAALAAMGCELYP
jgi:hypothetical protein